jgi:membrane protein DedA with SNARE-associated domain
MTDIFETIIEYSYFGIFLLLIGINAAPILMPPTWIVLSSFFALDSSLDPLLLALVGATGATIGRFFLKRISGFFRRFIGKEQESNLDIIGNFLNKKKFGYTLTSFLFAATPLPSNMLFVAYGMMRAKSIGLYIGFWCGRLVSYYIMITISEAVLTPFLRLFEDKIIGIIVADIVGIGSVIFFTCINWQALLFERKLRFVRPRFWRI